MRTLRESAILVEKTIAAINKNVAIVNKQFNLENKEERLLHDKLIKATKGTPEHKKNVYDREKQFKDSRMVRNDLRRMTIYQTITRYCTDFGISEDHIKNVMCVRERELDEAELD